MAIEKGYNTAQGGSGTCKGVEFWWMMLLTPKMEASEWKEKRLRLKACVGRFLYPGLALGK
jgi:hypothetical protein